MCWSSVAFSHCYECSREFNRRTHVIPCYASENGRLCAVKPLRHDVIQTNENCADCKAARSAEEECQRLLYRSRPLPLGLHVQTKKRMATLFAAFR
ncbi:hypothetical protein F4861DRAFT_495621 [Xylaria intraflava]|nr:hypothetical protein F4861DRAFT_495621 [Xylaria intraflava]